MKIPFLFFALLACFAMPVKAQVVPSSCSVPPALEQAYKRDWINLAMTAMYAAQSPDTQFVHVPAAWMDPIAGGMAAIFNASSITERDSVFDLYCVHDNASPIQTFQGYLFQVDTTYTWTQAWQNLNTLTGNAPLDSMLLKYDLEISQFFNWSFGKYALLQSDSLWNNLALIDSIETIPGIIYGEPDAIIGAAGRIEHSTSGNDRYYHFYFQFNDCFDGCDNYRRWSFRVLNDCSMEYLGFQDWGVFGLEPLPAPSNCNITTSSVSPRPTAIRVYPNPATTELKLDWDSDMKFEQLTLRDLQGKTWLESQNIGRHQSIDLKDLSPGMYLIELKGADGKSATVKVVKQ